MSQPTQSHAPANQNGLSMDAQWDRIVEELAKVSQHLYLKTTNCAIACADSRNALGSLPDESISCVITSPPYLRMKDYGTKEQIGFGQRTEEEYLPDLERVMSELYRVTKRGAALWMVLDMVKESGEMVALPWEVIHRARQLGWTFHDIVIWDKGKSLPWSSSGRFRGVCEFILLFGKGKLQNFNLDAVRDSSHLSPYWIKYPERYHPDGKAPSDLWHFPIPTQGSWAKDQSKHHCPFPIGLIHRMISISTEPGDTVLDPFAGTGSVAAIASYFDRRGVGVEINPTFVHEFQEGGYDFLTKRAQEEFPNRKGVTGSLRQIIINLRMLKYPKTLYAGVARGDFLGSHARDYIGGFLITRNSVTQDDDSDSLESNNLGGLDLKILLKPEADIEAVKDAVSHRTKSEPLSVFGIKASCVVLPFDSWNEMLQEYIPLEVGWFLYKNGNCNKYHSRIDRQEVQDLLKDEVAKSTAKIPPIISTICMSLDNVEHD